MKIKFDRPCMLHRLIRGLGFVFEPPGQLLLYCFFFRIVLHFKTHVQCHRCGRPAVLKCVSEEGYGLEYARDALCEKCGDLGQCPTDRGATHVLIPKSQIMNYETGEKV